MGPSQLLHHILPLHRSSPAPIDRPTEHLTFSVFLLIYGWTSLIFFSPIQIWEQAENHVLSLLNLHVWILVLNMMP
jgi:hypothetical protein